MISHQQNNTKTKPITSMKKQLQIALVQQCFFNKIPLLLKSKIFTYLTYQQLTTIVSIIGQYQQYEIMTKVIKNRIAFIGYLNRCDRSYYFGVYSLPIYQQYEEKNIQNIGLNGYQQIISQFPINFNKAIQQCKNCVNQEIKQQFGRQLEILFVDPCLPMPKLLRETAAAKVCSPFQNFLVSRLEAQNSFNNIYQPVFQQLQQNISQNDQVFIRSLIGNYQKANQLLNFAHLITYSNLNTNLIEENHLHNLLVYLFGVTQLYLSAVQQCLKNIQDPFEILLELCGRYGQFQSTVIAIEQNLGSLFKLYGSLFEELFGNANQFSYWKFAYTMWISKMNQFYEKTNNIFAQLIQQQSQQNLINILSNEKFTEISSNLKNSFLNKNKNSQHENSMLYSILKQEGELQVLINSYLEHLVDISSNQLNILYCGHSEQQLDEPFNKMEEKIIQNQSKFIEILSISSYSGNNKLQMTEIIQQKINHYASILKPKIIRNLSHQYKKEKIDIEVEQAISHEKQIEHYIQFLKRKNPNHFIQRKAFSMFNMAFREVEKTSLPETAYSQNDMKDQTFQMYQSDQQGQEKDSKYQIKKEKEQAQHLIKPFRLPKTKTN